MSLLQLTDLDLVFTDIAHDERDSLLRFFAERIARFVDLSPMTVFEGLMEREELGSTALGHGVAVPHCRVGGIERSWIAIGVAPEGVPFGAPDGLPVRAFFVIISPAADPRENLRCLATISHWVQEDDHLERLLEVPSAPAILELLSET